MRSSTPNSRLFTCGLCSIAASIATLVVTYTRTVHATNYVQQAYEGIPYLLCGLGSATIGVVLSHFGRGLWSTAAIVASSVLIVIWLLLGGTLV